MVSAFTGFVSGFSGQNLPDITPQALSDINTYRTGDHGTYIYELSVKEAKQKIEKEKFCSFEDIEKVLLTKFKHGKDKDGYWNYAYAAVQTEDALDIMRSLYSGNDIAFLYDQSSGYTKMRHDALKASSMGKFVGNKQPDICDTTVTAAMLGPYSNHTEFLRNGGLQVGSIQRFRLPVASTHPERDGPCHLTEMGRQQTQHSLSILKDEQ